MAVMSHQSNLLLTRRQLVAGGASGLLAGTDLLAGLVAAPAVTAWAAPRGWPADPFSLGVASGAPRPDGFVLWTRLAPDPLSANPATPGGMTGGDVSVDYEIATDEGMHDIVRRGTADAEAAFGWSVHADVTGLQPGRPYWYRFLSGEAVSRVGRAMTSMTAGTP